MADAQLPEPSAKPTTSTRGAKTPSGKSTSILDQRWPRLVLVLVIVLGIVGVTFAVGQKEGWTSIGNGGENAQLLPKVGQRAPELITATSDGSPVFLSSFIGHPIWLNFWGSWCEPCQAEMPQIESAYKVLQPQGIVMLAISQREDIETSLQYAQAAGATYPILADPAQVLSGINPNDPSMPPALRTMIQQTATWQVNNFPTHIFIDANGIVRAVVISQMNEDQAISYGNEILKIPYTGPPLATPGSSPAASPSASPSPQVVATPAA